jgi:3-dehydroquinate dehydratase type I
MLCIPIIAGNTQEALDRMATASPVADLMEIRLDLMDSFDIGIIIRSAVKPLLMTYRSYEQGGRGVAKPDRVAEYLMSAVKEGADLVDVELSMPRELLQGIMDSRGKTG